MDRFALSSPNEQFCVDARAFALVVSGPSGVGKTAICQALLERDGRVQPCVTTTTRARRLGEVDGVDYHFVPEADFREKLARGEFLEHAEVHGFHYGATAEAVRKAFSDGQVMLLDVDVQGAGNWRRMLGKRCVTVFVLPPSIEELRRRLEDRMTEGRASFQVRMQNARKELERASAYDFLIVNDRLEEAVLSLQYILGAERARPARMRAALAGLGGA